jgi:hypothetical protein
MTEPTQPTTPPGEPRRPPGYWPGMTGDFARMPFPGNAEFLVYLAALILAAIVAWVSNVVNVDGWFDFFQWTTIGYLLARGISKASRVLEQ